MQTTCHPVASPNKRCLKKCYSFIEKLFTRERLVQIFEEHHEKFIEQFLKRRTGVLSDNMQVRQIAKNILVVLSWVGQMEKLLPEMVPIFDYKPI